MVKKCFSPFLYLGTLAESKCYLITVTPVFADGPGSPESIKAYLKQARKSKLIFFKMCCLLLTKMFFLLKIRVCVTVFK